MVGAASSARAVKLAPPASAVAPTASPVVLRKFLRVSALAAPFVPDISPPTITILRSSALPRTRCIHAFSTFVHLVLSCTWYFHTLSTLILHIGIERTWYPPRESNARQPFHKTWPISLFVILSQCLATINVPSYAILRIMIVVGSSEGSDAATNQRRGNNRLAFSLAFAAIHHRSGTNGD